MQCLERCISWPAPDLACLPCLPPNITSDYLCQALAEANEAVWLASGGRYNGCDCWTEFQICPPGCTCDRLCSCDPCFIEMVDLSSEVCGQPLLEVVEVTLNGEPLADVEGYDLIENCYLRCPPTGWLPQSLMQTGCWWSVKIRYGSKPPLELLRLRDKYFIQLLKGCYPASYLACDTEGVESISFKGMTYRFDNERDILEKIACKYRPSPIGLARFSDVGDPTRQYKILKISEGSVAEPFDCDGWIAESFPTEVDTEPLQDAPIVVNPKPERLFNALGQLVIQ